MQNKLQELTDKLYNEGLSKGQQEGDALLAKANADANQLVENARKQAAQIVADAQKKAEELKKNTDAEITLAGRQVVSQLKQSVEGMIAAEAVANPTKAALGDTEFIQKIVLAAIERFTPTDANSANLSVLLPADMQAQLKEFAEGKLHAKFNQGVEVQFSKSFRTGFRIGVKDKGYYISFTDGDFENLFKEFLRPSLQVLLFGKEA